MFTETPEAQAIIAWHDSQTEELLASLPGYEDGLTPRQAWEAFCSLPATKQPGEGLAAPAEAGQGVGNRLDKRFNPGGVWANIPQVCPCCGSTDIHPACHTPPDPVSFCDSCGAEFCVGGNVLTSSQNAERAA